VDVSIAPIYVTILDATDSYGDRNPVIRLDRVINNSDPREILYTIPNNQTVTFSNGGFVTGTLELEVGSTLPSNSTRWFNEFPLYVTNQTTINVQSYNDLQIENQTNQLENQNSLNNTLSLFNAELVNSLEWLIVATILADLGFSAYHERH